MTQIEATDELPLEAVALPVIGRLGSAIDREFARRREDEESPYDYAAGLLGVPVTDLVVHSETLESVYGETVGHWMRMVHQRHGGPLAGAMPNAPASSETLPGAGGDVHAFRRATMLLPAKVLHTAPVAMRIVRGNFDHTVEVMAAREGSEGLATEFGRLLRECATSASPYLGGCYRVEVKDHGLALVRWHPGQVTRDTLKLAEAVWHTVDRSVHRVLELAEDLKARGLGTSSGVLLVGPPGTGKTQLGHVIAAELQGTATVLIPGMKAAEHFITDLFQLAADLAPCLVLMDDLDLVAGERGSMDPHKLREFLNVMDGGLADRSGVVVVASTNDHRKIDKAAQRSSRFDTVVKLDPPSYDGRLAILHRYLDWCPTELDLAAVARATDGATGADLKELVRAAVLETRDVVTTAALLAAAREGRWQKGAPEPGVYL